MYDLLQEDGSTEVKDTKPADPQARKKVDKREKSRRGGAHGGRGGVVVKSGGELVTQTRPKKTDRRSAAPQSGKSEKRHGSGSYNWGNPIADELQSQQTPRVEDAEPKPTQDLKSPQAESKDENVPPYISLDEFRAIQDQKRPHEDQKKPRAPNNEGNFKSGTEVRKKEKGKKEDKDEGKRPKQDNKKKRNEIIAGILLSENCS